MSSVQRVRSRSRNRETASATSQLDIISEALLYFVLLGLPWMFGGTSALARLFGFSACYTLAVLQLVKWFMERGQEKAPAPQGSKLWRALFYVNLLFLAYIAVSVINARANFIPRQQEFTYLESVSYLPSSYYRDASLREFWQTLALTCLFWGMRAWILSSPSGKGDEKRRSIVSPRIERFLWLLGISTACMAMLALLQRATGTNKFYWIYEHPWKSTTALYGPFPYRGNASQYFNLVWPALIGFWRYQLQTFKTPVRDGPYMILVPLALFIAIASIASLNRGGALVAIVVLALTVFVQMRNLARGARITALLVAGAIIVIGAVQGGQQLVARFAQHDPTASGRVAIYENSLAIVRDFPVFGVGPGAFGAVYHLYRAQYTQLWQSYAHSDWLEALVTTGIVGLIIQITLFGLIVAIVRSNTRRAGSQPIAVGILIAIGGCCLHALFDFPFQIFGILTLFTALCVVLTCVVPPPAKPPTIE